jgi:hypothetical protein
VARFSLGAKFIFCDRLSGWLLQALTTLVSQTSELEKYEQGLKDARQEVRILRRLDPNRTLDPNEAAKALLRVGWRGLFLLPDLIKPQEYQKRAD